MKKKLFTLTILSVLMLSNILNCVTPIQSKAAKKPELKQSNIRILIGARKTLSLKKGLKATALSWKASNKNVKVSPKGIVTGKKKGNAKITCTVTVKKKTYKLTCKATVVKGAKSVAILGKNNKKATKITMQVGGRYQLKNKISPKSSNDTVKWSISDKTVATVNGKGRITARGVGQAKVTAATLSGKKAKLTVKVERASRMVDLTKTLSEPALKDVYADHFSVGVAINGNAVENAMIRSEDMANVAKYHFNSLTYSNLMKPGYLLDQKKCQENAVSETDVYVKFDSCTEGLEFAKANNLKMRGHVLVWHNQTPNWFFRQGYDVKKPLADKETMSKRMENYIKQVLTFVQTNYPDVIYAWDVVNEAVETAQDGYDNSTGWYTRTHASGMENPWYETMGADYVKTAFEHARKYAAEGVKLIYNDYNTFEPLKRQAIYNMVSQINANGKLIDGIGMQSPILMNYPNMSAVEGSLKKFSELGVEIQMTEVTFRCDVGYNPDEQGKRAKEFFDVVMKMDSQSGGPANITNVTFFGMMDEYMLYDNNTECSWLFDRHLRPKPTFYAFLNANK